MDGVGGLAPLLTSPILPAKRATVERGHPNIRPCLSKNNTRLLRIVCIPMILTNLGGVDGGGGGARLWQIVVVAVWNILSSWQFL
jgi:hypothetical protein